MTISRWIAQKMESASWIRRMFEAGRQLKERLGGDDVYDLSLGNPVLEPPEPFFEALRELGASRGAGHHRYMPNAGFPQVRERVAAWVRGQGILDVSSEGVVMTVGAGGAISVALKALVDPGDEVVYFAPYFVEYLFYAEHCGGVPVVVETDERFDLDVAALEARLGPRTKVVMVNTPNNPTGRVYSSERLRALTDCLCRAERRFGRSIYLLSDEPYRPIVYEGKAPNFLNDYDNSILIYSWSKALSIPGDRIGFVAASPRCGDKRVADALTFANRTLGFVNAPATMQLAVLRLLDVPPPVEEYRRLRDRTVEGLRRAGYDFVVPEGAFYVFPRSPVPDDVAFAHGALQERVIVVPGSGFGRAGHFRLSFAVEEAMLDGGLAALGRVRAKLA